MIPASTTATSTTGGASAITTTSTGAGGSQSSPVAGKVSVRSVSPKSIASTDGKTFIVITGIGFKNVKDAVLGELPVLDFSVTSDGSLQFHLNPQVTPGTYDIQLILSDDSFINIPNAITVTNGTATTNTLQRAY